MTDEQRLHIQHLINSKLNTNGLDAEIYGDFILKIVESGDESELKAFLADCRMIADVDGFCQEVFEAYSSSQLLKIDKMSLKDVLDGMVEDDSRFLQESTEEYMQPEYEEEPITSEIDWISLADQVETTLVNKHSCQQVFNPEAILLALATCQGSITRSCTLLITAKEKQESCKPCRHLESGRCVRADCWFEHNLGTFPCRFWLLGNGCAKGLTCRFLHGLPPEDPTITTSPSSSAYNKAMMQQSEEQLWSWPALPVVARHDNVHAEPGFETINPAASIQAPPAVTVIAKKGSQKERKLAAKQQQQGGGVIVAAQPQTAFKIAPVAAGSYRSAALLSPSVGTSSSGSYRSTASSSAMAAASSSSSGYGMSGLADELRRRSFISSSSTSSSSSSSSSSSAAKGIAVGDWVSSGGSLRSEYHRLRDEARQLAIGRNTLLQEATIAYRGSNKSSARQLANRGQELNQAMHAAHEQAAKTLFRDRNPFEQLQRGIIDLHGLHVSEARACLLELLPLFMAVGGSIKSVRVITGSGHHSIAYGHGTARLLPEVKRLCSDEMGLSIKEVKDSSGYVSAVNVSW